jgi:hypothetical protein
MRGGGGGRGCQVGTNKGGQIGLLAGGHASSISEGDTKIRQMFMGRGVGREWVENG